MQSTIPNVDVELIRHRFDQITSDLNLCSTRATGNRGLDTREVCKAIQSFSQLMEQITNDYGTHPQHVVGQHVCCNTLIMVLEFAVKPALSYYCSTTASKIILNAQQQQQRIVAVPTTTGSGGTRTEQHVVLLKNRDGPRQSKKAQQLRQDVVRPFIDLVLTLHRSLPLEPILARPASGGGGGGTSGVAGGVEHATSFSSLGASSRRGAEQAGLSSAQDDATLARMMAAASTGASFSSSPSADGFLRGGGESRVEDGDQRHLTDVFAMSSVVSPLFSTAALPSTAPLLWKHGEPLRILTQHALEVLESDVLCAVVGQEYANMLATVLSLDSYARAVPTVFVRALTDRLLTLLERVEPDSESSAAGGGGGGMSLFATNAAAVSSSSSSFGTGLSATTTTTTTTAPIVGVSSDEAVIYARLFLVILSLSQFTTSFRTLYLPLTSRATTNPHTFDQGGVVLRDPESMESVMQRLCRLLHHWHQHTSTTLRLEAAGLQALTQLVHITLHDYPSVAAEPLDLLKPLCDACYRAETFRKDHWRLDMLECVTVQLCHQFAPVLGRQVSSDCQRTFLGHRCAISPEVPPLPSSSSVMTRSISPRALLLLHETVLPMALQLFSQTHHEYSFMSRRDLFFFPCEAVQTVLEFGAIVVYLASSTHDAYVAERSRIDGAGCSCRGGADVRESPEERVLRALRFAFSGDAEDVAVPATDHARGRRAANNEEEEKEEDEVETNQSTFDSRHRGAYRLDSAGTRTAGTRGTALPSLSDMPSWLLRANTNARGGGVHISSLSDAALFHLHLLAQPCTTLHWSVNACDALVEEYLCPLLAIYGERLSRLLIAALEVTIPRCARLVQQRVFHWAVRHAMPGASSMGRLSSAAATANATSGIASSAMNSATLSNGFGGGGGAWQDGYHAPQLHWFKLLSALLDRAVLGTWSLFVPQLPIRALFVRSADVCVSRLGARAGLSHGKEAIEEALAMTHNAVTPWFRTVLESRVVLEQGNHVAFFSAQAEQNVASRERRVLLLWSRHHGSEKKSTTTSRLAFDGETSENDADNEDSADGDRDGQRSTSHSRTTHWQGRGGATSSTSAAAAALPGGGSLLSNAASAAATPVAVLNESLNAVTTLTSQLTPVLFLTMLRFLTSSELLCGRGAADQMVASLDEQDDDDAIDLLNEDDNDSDGNDNACAGETRDAHISAVRKLSAFTTSGRPFFGLLSRLRNDTNNTTNSANGALSLVSHIHDSLAQIAAVQEAQLLHMLNDSEEDPLPPLDTSLRFVHDAFAHNVCLFRPQREDSVKQQLRGHHAQRQVYYRQQTHRDADDEPVRHGRGGRGGVLNVTTATSVLMGAPLPGLGRTASAQHNTDNNSTALSALLSSGAGGAAGNAVSSIATTSAALSSGLAQAQAWQTWTAMLDEAVRYTVLAVSSACRRSLAAMSASSASVLHAAATTQHRCRQDLTRRHTQPQRCVPQAAAYAAEGQWLLRYPALSSSFSSSPTSSPLSSSGAAASRAQEEAEGVHDNADSGSASGVVGGAVEAFAVAVPRLWLTVRPVLMVLSETVIQSFLLFVRRTRVAKKESELFTRCQAAGPRAGLAQGDKYEAEAAVDAEGSAQIHSVLCVQAAQFLQWLVRLYGQGLWAPPGAQVEDTDRMPPPQHPNNKNNNSSSRRGADGDGLSEEEEDLHVLRTTSTSSWFAQPGPTLERLSPSGRIFLAVLWLTTFLHEQLGEPQHDDAKKTEAGEASHLSRTQPIVANHTKAAVNLSLVSSRTALLALLHLFSDVGEIMLHPRFACADPGQILLSFVGSLSRRLLTDGVRELVLNWRPADALAQELLLPIFETAQLSLKLIVTILWTAQRTRVRESAADPFISSEAVCHLIHAILTEDSLLARRGQVGSSVNDRKPFVPFSLPLLEPLLQLLLLLRFDFDNESAREAYWQVVQTVYVRYAGSATPTLFRVLSTTASFLMSSALASRRTATWMMTTMLTRTKNQNGDLVDRTKQEGKSRFSQAVARLCAEQHIENDGALLQWLVDLVEGRAPSTTTHATRATVLSSSASSSRATAALSLGTVAVVPSSAPLTPPLECALLSATFSLLPLCDEVLSEQLGRHTFSSLSSDAAYGVRRHTACQVHVLFRLFQHRGDRVLRDLLHVCRGGILSANPLLCATSLLALSEAAKAAPWLETSVVYTLLECWATRGFCFRGQVLECLQSIAEGGTLTAAPFNTIANVIGSEGASGRGGVSVSDAFEFADGPLRGDGEAWLEQLMQRQQAASDHLTARTKQMEEEARDDHREDHNSSAQGGRNEEDHGHTRKRPRASQSSSSPHGSSAAALSSHSTLASSPSSLACTSAHVPAFAAMCQAYSGTLLFQWLWEYQHSLDAFPFLCFGCASLDQFAWQHATSLLSLSFMLSSSSSSASAATAAVQRGGGVPPGSLLTGSGRPVLDLLVRAVKCAWREQYMAPCESRLLAQDHVQPPDAQRARREVVSDARTDQNTILGDALSAYTTLETTMRLVVLCFAPLVAQLVLLATHQTAENEGEEVLFGATRGGGGGGGGTGAEQGNGVGGDEASARIGAAAEAALYWLQTVFNEAFADDAHFERVLKEVRPELGYDRTLFASSEDVANNNNNNNSDESDEEAGEDNAAAPATSRNANTLGTMKTSRGSARSFAAASASTTQPTPFIALLSLEADRVFACLTDAYTEEKTTTHRGSVAGLERGLERVADWLLSTVQNAESTLSSSSLASHGGATKQKKKKRSSAGEAAALLSQGGNAHMGAGCREETLLWRVLASDQDALDNANSTRTKTAATARMTNLGSARLSALLGPANGHSRLYMYRHWLRRNGGGDAACALLTYMATRAMSPPTQVHALASQVWLPATFFAPASSSTTTMTMTNLEVTTAVHLENGTTQSWTPARWSPHVFFRSAFLEARLELLRHAMLHWLSPHLLCCPPVLQTVFTIVLRLLQPNSSLPAMHTLHYAWSAQAVEYVRGVACNVLLHVWPLIAQLTCAPGTSKSGAATALGEGQRGKRETNAKRRSEQTLAMSVSQRTRALLMGSRDIAIATTLMALASDSAVVASTWSVLCRVDPVLRAWDWQRLAVRGGGGTTSWSTDAHNWLSSSSLVSSDEEDNTTNNHNNNDDDDDDEVQRPRKRLSEKNKKSKTDVDEDDDVMIVDVDEEADADADEKKEATTTHTAEGECDLEHAKMNTVAKLSRRHRRGVAFILSLLERLPLVVGSDGSGFNNTNSSNSIGNAGSGGTGAGIGAPATRYVRELTKALDEQRDALVYALRRSTPADVLRQHSWTDRVREALTEALQVLLRVTVPKQACATMRTAKTSRAGGGQQQQQQQQQEDAQQDELAMSTAFTARTTSSRCGGTMMTTTTTNTAATNGAHALFDLMRAISWCFLEVGEGRSLEKTLIQQSTFSTGWLVLPRLSQYAARSDGSAGATWPPLAAGIESSSLRPLSGSPRAPLTLVPQSPTPNYDNNGNTRNKSVAAAVATTLPPLTLPRSPIDVIQLYQNQHQPLSAALEEIAGLHYAQLLDALRRLAQPSSEISPSVGAITSALASRTLRACLAREEVTMSTRHEEAEGQEEEDEEALQSVRALANGGTNVSAAVEERAQLGSGAAGRGVMKGPEQQLAKLVSARSARARECTTIDGVLLLLARETIQNYCALFASDKYTCDGLTSSSSASSSASPAPLSEIIEQWRLFPFRRYTTFEESLLHSMIADVQTFNAIVGPRATQTASCLVHARDGHRRGLAVKVTSSPSVALASTLVSCSPLPYAHRHRVSSPSASTAAKGLSLNTGAAAASSSPLPLHLLDDALWQELSVFSNAATFLPLLVLALIDTYRLDEKIQLLALVKPLLRAEAAAATALSVNQLLRGSAGGFGAEENTTASTARARVRARQRQLRLDVESDQPRPFWLCLVSLAPTSSTTTRADWAEHAVHRAPLVVDVYTAMGLATSLDVADAALASGDSHSSSSTFGGSRAEVSASTSDHGGDALSATLLPLVFFHVMLQNESESARQLRHDWSLLLDVHVLSQPQSYPRLVRLLLHTLYEGCYGPLTATLSSTGLRGFKPPKGVVEMTGDAMLGVQQSCLLGKLPVVTTMRECFWLSDIPALHLSHAAAVVQEPYLATLFAELSAESILTMDVLRTPSGGQGGASANGFSTATTTATMPASSEGEEVNGGLPVTVAVLSGVDGRRGDVLWLPESASSSSPALSHGGASPLFPLRAARGGGGGHTTHGANNTALMQTSSKSRRARAEAREAALQARFQQLRSQLIPILATAQSLLPVYMEGRVALAQQQMWRAEAALTGTNGRNSLPLYATSSSEELSRGAGSLARYWTLGAEAMMPEEGEAHRLARAPVGRTSSRETRGQDAQERMRHCVHDAEALVMARRNYVSALAEQSASSRSRRGEDGPDDAVDASSTSATRSALCESVYGECEEVLRTLDTASHQLHILHTASNASSRDLSGPLYGDNNTSCGHDNDDVRALRATLLTAKASNLLRAGLYDTAQEMLSGAVAAMQADASTAPMGSFSASPSSSSSSRLWQASPVGRRSNRLKGMTPHAETTMRAYLAEAAWRCGTWQPCEPAVNTLLSFAATPTPDLVRAKGQSGETDALRQNEEQEEDVNATTKVANKGVHGRQQPPRSTRTRATHVRRAAATVLETICDASSRDDDAIGNDEFFSSTSRTVKNTAHASTSAPHEPVTPFIRHQLGLRGDRGGGGMPLPGLTGIQSYQEAILSALLTTSQICQRGNDSNNDSNTYLNDGVAGHALAQVVTATRDGMEVLRGQLQPTTWLSSMVAAEALKDVSNFARRQLGMSENSREDANVDAQSLSAASSSHPPRWLLPVLRGSGSDLCDDDDEDAKGSGSPQSGRSRRAPLPLEVSVLEAVRLSLCRMSGNPAWSRAYAHKSSRDALTHTATPQLALRWLRDLDLDIRLQQLQTRRLVARLGKTVLPRFACAPHEGGDKKANAKDDEEHSASPAAISGSVSKMGSHMVSDGVEAAVSALAGYADALSFTDSERVELTLLQAQALYAMGAKREAIARLQNIAADGVSLPFSKPSINLSRTAGAMTAATTPETLLARLRLITTNTEEEAEESHGGGGATSLFQLPVSAATDSRVVHQLMTWLHADAVAPLSQLVRDAYFTRCAVHDATGACSFLLARLCHVLARDIAARVRTYDFAKMQSSLADSRQQERALMAQHARLKESGQLTDREERVLLTRIKNLQGDVEQEERELLSEVRNYHLYRRSALNSYGRYLQVTSASGDRDVHAVFGLAELWFQSEERASGSTLLLEEDDDDEEEDELILTVHGGASGAAVAAHARTSSAKRSDASGGGGGVDKRKADKTKSSAHVTTEVLVKALTQVPSFRFIPIFSQLTARLSGLSRRSPAETTATTTHNTSDSHRQSEKEKKHEAARGSKEEDVAAVAIGRRNSVRLYRLVERVARDHPLYAVWPLLALARGDEFGQTAGALHQADRDKVACANRILSDIQNGHVTTSVKNTTATAMTTPLAQREKEEKNKKTDADDRRTARYIQDARDLSAAYHELGAYKVSGSTSRPHRIAPDFQILEKIHDLSIPLPTVTLPTHTNATTTDADLCALIPRIHAFENTYTTPGGINVPKVLVCVLSDGSCVRQLLKANDDLRQDALIEQSFRLANTLFLRGAGTDTHDDVDDLAEHVTDVGADTHTRSGESAPGLPPLHVHTYNVVPLSPSAGVIEWVNDTVPFGEYIAGRFGNVHCTPGAHERYFPHEITNWECREKLQAAGRRDLAARHHVLLELYASYSPALHYYFTENFLSVHEWLQARQNFTLSVAASSLAGFAVGLGDRHGSNLLLHKKTGELVHIDLGIAFDQSRLLPVPELVPFRLTRNVVDGFGVRGVDGGFRERCEEAMCILRARRGLLLAVLEAFLYDPIAKWSVVAKPAVAEDKDDTMDAVHGQHKAVRTTTTNTGDAQRTLARVQAKLKGYDGGEQLRVPAHVQKLIHSAQSTANLSAMFEGWSPWL